MKREDVTINALIAQMDQHQPKWWLRWADQVDLLDALVIKAEQQEAFLKGRCHGKVHLVANCLVTLLAKESKNDTI